MFALWALLPPGYTLGGKIAIVAVFALLLLLVTIVWPAVSMYMDGYRPGDWMTFIPAMVLVAIATAIDLVYFRIVSLLAMSITAWTSVVFSALFFITRHRASYRVRRMTFVGLILSILSFMLGLFVLVFFLDNPDPWLWLCSLVVILWIHYTLIFNIGEHLERDYCNPYSIRSHSWDW